MEKSLFSRTIDHTNASGINLLQNHEALAVDFDNKKVLAKDLINNVDKTFYYDKLVIATGAKAILPDIKGLDSRNIYTITKPYMGKKLKEDIKNFKNIGIVGGGFIGVEIADQLSNYDHLKINLYHSRDYLLSNVYDREAGKAIEKELEKLKVNIHFSQRLIDLEAKDSLVKEIITTSRKDPLDALILAIGFKPNTDIFSDANLLKTKKGAIVIDKFGRTSIEDVWSVGDCATVPHKFLGNVHIPLGTSANKIARQIGSNLFLEEDQMIGNYESLGSNALKVGDLEFASTGLTEVQASKAGFNYGLADSKMRNKPSYMGDSSELNFRLIYERETYKILGARVFGKKDAVLRLLPFTSSIHAGLTTKDLAFHDFAYSPPFNTVWEPVNIAASVAK